MTVYVLFADCAFFDFESHYWSTMIGIYLDREKAETKMEEIIKKFQTDTEKMLIKFGVDDIEDVELRIEAVEVEE